MLMGDFNIDVNTNVTPTRDYLHMLQSNACINLITKPTRVTSKTQTIIDHIVFFYFKPLNCSLGFFVVVNYMHHGDDLVEHRAREASFGAQCTNHSANSMCY